MAKDTVGNIYGSRTVGDLNFIFCFVCKMNVHHWIYLETFKWLRFTDYVTHKNCIF